MQCGQPSSRGPKKLVQVSEEFQKPVHVPFVLGSDCFVITQQDMRKIEDVRFLSYHKLGPNGELIPVEGHLGQDNALSDALLNAARFHHQTNSDGLCRQLIELIGRSCSVNAPPCPTRATIAQQMEWEHAPSSSSPAYPFTYNKSTSMDTMPRQVRCCNHQPCKCSCSPRYIVHEACNTMDESSTDSDGLPSARQMLKLRKITQDTLGV